MIFQSNLLQVIDMIPAEYKDDEEIIRKTIEQVKKDFGTLLPELKFSGSKKMLFEELAVQVEQALYHIHKSSPMRFKSVLYRVDVSEKEIRPFLARNDYRGISETLIRREFGKVLTRRFFKG